MNNYITIENEYYILLIPESLKEYSYEVLDYSSNKMKEYLDFFKEDSYGKIIKASFLPTREEFVKRIKELSPNANPPSWATGCFYGGEIQLLIDFNDLYKRFNTLAHETFHLLFQKFIYNNYKIDRIIWLDESLAGNFDDTTQKKIDNGDFNKIIQTLKNKSNLPIMNNINFSDNDQSIYDLFKVVGRYLIETKTNDELLDYVKDEKRVLEDGKTILKDSINYFDNQ